MTGNRRAPFFWAVDWAFVPAMWKRNQPQCAILGVGKIEKRVKVIDDAIAIRPLAYVSLTFDHRILDGKSADDFLATFKEIIEGWR